MVKVLYEYFMNVLKYKYWVLPIMSIQVLSTSEYFRSTSAPTLVDAQIVLSVCAYNMLKIYFVMTYFYITDNSPHSTLVNLYDRWRMDPDFFVYQDRHQMATP